MDKKGEERRQNGRALFTIENGILASFIIPGIKTKTMTAYVLNLSTGGIFFTMRKEEISKIAKGEKVIFLEIKLRNSKPFILNAEADIIWKTEEATTEYSGVGCRFLKLSSSSDSQISRFIELWHQKTAENVSH